MTVTSPFSNPVTVSEKVNFAVNGVLELIAAGTPPISSPREVVSLTFTTMSAPVRPS